MNRKRGKPRVRKVAKDSVPIETFPQYLKRLASDLRDSGHEFTAQDFEESADLIEDLYSALVQYAGPLRRNTALLNLGKRVTR